VCRLSASRGAATTKVVNARLTRLAVEKVAGMIRKRSLRTNVVDGLLAALEQTS
jgi:hypothetical protein